MMYGVLQSKCSDVVHIWLGDELKPNYWRTVVKDTEDEFAGDEDDAGEDDVDHLVMVGRLPPPPLQ